MRKLMLFTYSHPLLILLLLSVLCVLSAFQVPDLRQDPSTEGLMLEGDPARAFYEETREIFGTDQVSVIFIKDKDIFTPEKLGVLEDLVFKLEELPGVARVESIFSATNFKSENGVLNSAPLIDWIPETKKEAGQVMRDAVHNPVLKGNLISGDGLSTAINLFIEPDESNPNFYTDFTDRVQGILRPLEKKFNTIFQLGNPYFRALISRMMARDQQRLVPLSMLVLLLALILTTGKISGAVLPLLTSGMSILLTMGFMGLTGIPLNILTVIVPSLIIVIGSTEDIHLLSEYISGVKIKKTRDLAIEFMISKMGTVIMVTALTTFLGFLSICVNKITILRQFGMAASFGLFVNPVITCLFAPVYFRFFGTSGSGGHSDNPQQEKWSLFNVLADFVTKVVITRKKAVLFIVLGLTLLIGLPSINVRINNDILSVFKKNSPVIRKVNEMSDELAGVQTFFIRIRGGHDNIFKSPENLGQIADIQDFIRKKGVFDKTVSLVDILKLINREMNEGDPAKYILPGTVEQVSQFLLFLRDEEMEPYVTPNFSEVNILVRHNITSSYEQKKALGELKDFIEKRLNPHFKYDFTGESILTLRAADFMARGQVKSITLLLFIIFVIMSVMFLNAKAGLISLVPNILPIAIYFGVMGIFSIPLNIGTAMVAAMAIGIAVDDTIHFMARYNSEMHVLKDQQEAMRVCIRSEIRPAVSTSMALAAGFVVLAFSNFVSIIHFGILSALVMIVALIVDLFLTPILLSSTRLLTLWDILSLHLRKEVIEQSEFFRDLKLWQIKKIVLLGRIREAGAGEMIYHEWDEGDSMFLLLEGRVRIYGTQEDTDKEVPYAPVNPGDVFGQIAMLDQGPRSANARVMSDIKYVEISRDDFGRLHGLYPHIASKAYRNLARILGHQLVISHWRYRAKVGTEQSEG